MTFKFIAARVSQCVSIFVVTRVSAGVIVRKNYLFLQEVDVYDWNSLINEEVIT